MTSYEAGGRFDLQATEQLRLFAETPGVDRPLFEAARRRALALAFDPMTGSVLPNGHRQDTFGRTPDGRLAVMRWRIIGGSVDVYDVSLRNGQPRTLEAEPVDEIETDSDGNPLFEDHHHPGLPRADAPTPPASAFD